MLASGILALSLAPLLVQSAPARFYFFDPLHPAGPSYKRDSTTTPATTITLTQTIVVTPSAATNGGPTASSAASDAVLLLPAVSPPSPQAPFHTEESTQDPDRPLVMAYYPDWAGTSFPPEKIDFSRYDWIDFAFALPDENFGLTWDSDQAPALLSRLVSVAHRNNKKVKLSVGGWTGSTYFSPAVASNQSRQTFANNIVAIYNEYNLDGIDIDWEYPGQEGERGNQVDSHDTANLLFFLQHLRTVLPASARITCATQTLPFVDNHGQPMSDVSEFAKVLDWVLLMNYDTWGSSSDPGPNAPLSDACKNSSQPEANAVAAYNAWTSAGFKPLQIVLGIPSYGYLSMSNVTNLRTRSQSRSAVPSLRRSSHGNVNKRDQMSKVVGEDGGYTGQVQFRELLKQGALVRTKYADANNAPAFNGAGGFERYWDNCSSTPYLRSASANQIITYDDSESLYMKAKFAKLVGMRGTNMFDVRGDTDEWDLTDSARRGLGLI